MPPCVRVLLLYLRKVKMAQTINGTAPTRRAKRKNNQGVSFNKRDKKWVSRISISGRQFSIGYYDDEDCAHDILNAVKDHSDDIADFLENIPDDGDKVLAFADYIREHVDINKKAKTSKYRGVSFKQKIHKWSAFIIIDGHLYHIGYYDDEETANYYSYETSQHLNSIKKIISEQVDFVGKTVAFAAFVKEHIDNARHQKTSEYRGVDWDENSQKWKCRISICGHSYFLGRYPPDEEGMAGWTYEWVRRHKAELETINDHVSRRAEVALLLMLRESFHT